MSFYEPQSWQAPGRQASWETPNVPSRSGSNSASQQQDDTIAFTSQFEEVERAIENLSKSGKYFSQGQRRDSLPMVGMRPFSEYDNRMHGGMNNRHSMGEFDQGRSHGGSNLQNYYASQRYQGRSENDQMAHAKRRMAAQRERELRNYHQEQQYNRSVLAEMSSSKSDRSMSPGAVSEEGRRDLIARQHRALYGNEAPPFFQPGGFEDNTSRPETQGSAGPPSAGPGMRGSSPRARDPFGVNPNSGKTTTADGNTVSSLPQEATKANDPSPASGTAPNTFGAFDQAPPQNNKPASPSGGESPSRQAQKSATAPIGSGMGPIGSRPQQAGVQSLNKRSTTPLTYGKGSNDNTTERSASAASNPSGAAKEPNNVWGNGSGVWGTKSSLGATSVWG